VPHIHRGRRSHMPRMVVIALILVALTWSPGGSAAAVDGSPRSPEYVIKAAYLYNFAMFVEWPSDAFATPDSPLLIGVVGADPFGWALERTVQGKRINKRRIVIDRVQSVQDARRCHIVFISVDDDTRVSEYSTKLNGLSVLLVGDSEDVLKQGASISFTVRDNKVGYDVNLDAAKRARLTVSSKLLNLARMVHRS
jgi:YfiR/HmsC-like